MDSSGLYEGTEFKMVPASAPVGDTRDLAVGIVHTIAGERFGYYADCGVVHTEER